MENKINVLIVEDCRIMQLVVHRIFEISGIDYGEIYQATNGLEGLNILKNCPVDLLILDVNMPVMDGIEMLKEADKDKKIRNIPVITVSAESNPYRIHYLEKRSAAFIHKPFTAEKFEQQVKAIRNKLQQNKQAPVKS